MQMYPTIRKGTLKPNNHTKSRHITQTMMTENWNMMEIMMWEKAWNIQDVKTQRINYTAQYTVHSCEVVNDSTIRSQKRK